MEVILERAAREGKVWLSRSNRFRTDDRLTWVMPDPNDMSNLKAWIDRYLVVQLAVGKASSASAIEELLYAADKSWLADRFSKCMLFPRAMFEEIIWPKMAAHLMHTRTIGIRTLTEDTRNTYGAATIITMFQGNDIAEAERAITERISSATEAEGLQSYLLQSAEALEHYWDDPSLAWPVVLDEVVTPLWLGKVLPPSGFMIGRYCRPNLSSTNLTEATRGDVYAWLTSSWNRNTLAVGLAKVVLPAMLLSGFDLVRPATQLR